MTRAFILLRAHNTKLFHLKHDILCWSSTGGPRNLRMMNSFHTSGLQGGLGGTAYPTAATFPHYAVQQGIPYNVYGYFINKLPLLLFNSEHVFVRCPISMHKITTNGSWYYNFCVCMRWSAYVETSWGKGHVHCECMKHAHAVARDRVLPSMCSGSAVKKDISMRSNINHPYHMGTPHPWARACMDGLDAHGMVVHTPREHNIIVMNGELGIFSLFSLVLDYVSDIHACIHHPYIFGTY